MLTIFCQFQCFLQPTFTVVACGSSKNLCDLDFVRETHLHQNIKSFDSIQILAKLRISTFPSFLVPSICPIIYKKSRGGQWSKKHKRTTLLLDSYLIYPIVVNKQPIIAASNYFWQSVVMDNSRTLSEFLTFGTRIHVDNHFLKLVIHYFATEN